MWNRLAEKKPITIDRLSECLVSIEIRSHRHTVIFQVSHYFPTLDRNHATDMKVCNARNLAHCCLQAKRMTGNKCLLYRADWS